MRCVVCTFFSTKKNKKKRLEKKRKEKKLYCGINCEVYWSVPAFFASLCSVLSAASLLMCCPLCLAHIKVCCGFQGKKKTYFYSFNVRSQQILFFQHNAFWTIVLKNVYFNIYLLHDLYIFVIYNWINFICCEIKSDAFGVIDLKAAQETEAEANKLNHWLVSWQMVYWHKFSLCNCFVFIKQHCQIFTSSAYQMWGFAAFLTCF